MQRLMQMRVCGSPAVDGYAHVKPDCLEASPTNKWWQVGAAGWVAPSIPTDLKRAVHAPGCNRLALWLQRYGRCSHPHPIDNLIPACLPRLLGARCWQETKPKPDDLDIHIERHADYDGLAGALPTLRGPLKLLRGRQAAGEGR